MLCRRASKSPLPQQLCEALFERCRLESYKRTYGYCSLLWERSYTKKRFVPGVEAARLKNKRSSCERGVCRFARHTYGALRLPNSQFFAPRHITISAQPPLEVGFFILIFFACREMPDEPRGAADP